MRSSLCVQALVPGPWVKTFDRCATPGDESASGTPQIDGHRARENRRNAFDYNSDRRRKSTAMERLQQCES
jgi:hypothetical protein